jgi:hypothetical protein
MDGQQQRKAPNAAERTIAYLAHLRSNDAGRAAMLAAEVNQIGIFSSFSDAVRWAIADMDSGDSISEQTRAVLREAVGPGPLAAAVDQL